MPVLASLGVLLPVALGAVVLSVRASHDPTYATYGERLAVAPRVVPAERPPVLEDLWTASSADPPLDGVTFYSRDRPLVTLCVGPVATCRSHMGMTDVLRTEQVGSHLVTIGVINPGHAQGLGRRLLRYWQTVPLVAVDEGRPVPAWLGDTSDYSS